MGDAQNAMVGQYLGLTGISGYAQLPEAKQT